MDERTIPCPLREAAMCAPETPAITGADGATSYGELDGRVSAAAARLREMGCGGGERVGLCLPKDGCYLVLLLALIRAGAVACPLSDRVPQQGLAALLRKSGCTALISEGPALEALDYTGIRKLTPDTLLQDVGRGVSREPLPLSLDRPATIIFTSGSSGEPRAALHTLGNHYYSALGSNENIELEPGDHWLHSLPLYHVGGLSILFRCLLAGAAVTLPKPGATLGRSIAENVATHVSLVATQLRRLLGDNADLRSLKAALLGGGPVPDALLDEAVSRGLPVHTSYGLTEMASQVTSTRSGARRDELRTAGRPLPHREVAVSGEGEILVRGETLFAGYVAGDGVECPLDADGWFHTGDLGELDGEGRLRVLGRRDNMFISGGENVQPEEIEEALHRIEGVEEAVVAPVPDEEFGERLVAFVRMGRDSIIAPGDLAAELEKWLPRFKVPVAFHPWPEEASAGIKPDRGLFRELALRFNRRA